MNTVKVNQGEGFPFPVPPKTDPSKYLAKVTDDPVSLAFSEKFTIHAGLGGGTADAAEVPRIFSELLGKAAGPLAIYVHVPFCLNHCLYCGFAGKTPARGIGTRYAAAVREELKFLGDKKAAEGPVRTVYFGGGTPSCLDPGDLKSIVDTLKANFRLANDCEITL
ncbi:MAG: hypothetical protein LBF41_05545, partial [Deltaproteobacteria bacterium]|nr:hypothetical protein [Deltaproteobacteria bacterium]